MFLREQADGELRSRFEVFVRSGAGRKTSQGRTLRSEEKFFKDGALRESVRCAQMLEAALGRHCGIRVSRLLLPGTPVVAQERR